MDSYRNILDQLNDSNKVIEQLKITKQIGNDTIDKYFQEAKKKGFDLKEIEKFRADTTMLSKQAEEGKISRFDLIKMSEDLQNKIKIKYANKDTK